MAVIIEVYADDWEVCSKNEKPKAILRATMPMGAARQFAAKLQKQAGGQAASVRFEAMDWESAEHRYAMMV